MLLVICGMSLWACRPNGNSQTMEQLSAQTIVQKAHEAAGGTFWRKPESLLLTGHASFHTDDTIYHHEKHVMYRVFDSEKQAAHKPDGKVRIASYREGDPVILLAYDGEFTYDKTGRQDLGAASKRWASNFGFGVIRHALDTGYQLMRLTDGEVNQQGTYRISVIDHTGSSTLFDIRQEDFAIVQVAFDTPRGWHHRIYSDFLQKDEYSWNQACQVELYYDSSLQNVVYWTDFEVNVPMQEALFTLRMPEDPPVE